MSINNNTTAFQLMTQNPYQNAGQATVNGFSNNLPYCDFGRVTAEEFNTKISASPEAGQVVLASEDEHLFGSHLREAKVTMRKIFGR